MRRKLIVGLDFGTDSARAILVDGISGKQLAQAVHQYPRWNKGEYCRPDRGQYRQHPLDYIDAIDVLFTDLFVHQLSDSIIDVVAIGTNTTGSTPVAVDQQGQPLSLRAEFQDNPNAMFILWKDHMALEDAADINRIAKKWPVDYTAYSGGNYSSEWFWSKILRVHRVDPQVAQHAYTWLEQSDWIPAYLSGVRDVKDIKRNRCAAGHKAMWHKDHGGLPSPEFLCAVDACLAPIAERFYQESFTSDQTFGHISADLVAKYGFDPHTIITVGGIDAHHGAIGSGAQPYVLVKVIGTSTCDMLTIPQTDHPQLVPGICGQVEGSIDPSMIGFEAGQSAYGDIFSWFKRLIVQPTVDILGESFPQALREQLDEQFFSHIGGQAYELPLSASDLIITDYFNGRRTPDADFSKKSAMSGLTLAHSAAHLFKALVEGAAFGSRAIMERFEAYNIPIHRVIATGGIASRSAYVVQVLADILGREIDVVDSDQTGALGSVIFAAQAAALYGSMEDAQAALAARVRKTYSPIPENNKVYTMLYTRYMQLTKLPI